jgi:squalene-associated FAD-dependent desaturase
MRTGRVAVVGGGLAGLTAALQLADAGLDVTLLEGKPRLGGQTYSFHRGELVVDNGQHVFLRCCTSYLRLLERLGVSDLVTLGRLDVPVVDAVTGRTHRLRRNGLPAPLHLAGSLLGYAALSPRQRLRMVLATMALRGVDASSEAVDNTSFGDWLREHRQDARTLQAVWDLIGVATLNARAGDASLSLAATVFQIGLLTKGSNGDIGWSKVPLQQLHGDPAAAELSRLGATVLTNARVEGIDRTPEGWRVTSRDGESQVYDSVVLAVPPAAAEQLLPAASTDLPSGWAARLGTSPIVSVHVVYDRKVLDEPFIAGLGTSAPWVFDCTDRMGVTTGQAVTVPISAADDVVDLTAAELRALVERDLEWLLPRTKQAVVRDFFVTREREATFRPSPGSHALRPGTATSAPGLFLAGAWTDTGWPATMEGAVRSGEAAAAAVLALPAPATSVSHVPSPTDGVPA